MKALRLLQRDFPIGGVSMRLVKRIPVGAGLGGGSSDAAAVLNALNELFQLNLSVGDLQCYAAQLGSDVAFFIQSVPVYATGRGELMKPIDLDLSKYEISVIHPGIHISTAEAYAGVKPQKADYSLEEAVKLPVSEWKNVIHNDFEVEINALPAVQQDVALAVTVLQAVFAAPAVEVAARSAQALGTECQSQVRGCENLPLGQADVVVLRENAGEEMMIIGLVGLEAQLVVAAPA